MTAEQGDGRGGAGGRGGASPTARSGCRLGGGARIPGSTSRPARASTATDKVWLDHLEIPFGFLRDYIARVEAGQESIARRPQIAAERDRITASTASCCPTTRRARPSTGSSAWRGWCSPTSRTTTSTSSTGRCRSSGARSASSAACSCEAGFWADADDIFYLRRDELQPGAVRLRQRLGRGRRLDRPVALAGRDRAPHARSSRRWRLSRRVPAMNQPPEVVTEPFTIMLYGITTERVAGWLRAASRPARAHRHGRLAGQCRRASRAS